MRRYSYYFILLLILFLIQSAAEKVFWEYRDFIPQLVFLFVAVVAVTRPLVDTLWWSFVAGFLLEIVSSQFFGSFIVSLLIVGSLIYLLTRKITLQDAGLMLVLVLVASATVLFPLWVYFYQALLALFGLTMNPYLREFYSFGLIWTIVVNVLFFYIVKWTFRPVSQS